MLEVDLDWTDKTGQKPPSPLFKGEVRLDEKKENKERQVAETMLKAWFRYAPYKGAPLYPEGTRGYIPSCSHDFS